MEALTMIELIKSIETMPQALAFIGLCAMWVLIVGAACWMLIKITKED